ncbi:hypothetical protein TIFTF001_010840 [Ficus carica]|uniref:BURP domain-containing protein n=1 Tax=Ficus carica TaxID=3494 RepID=A0AA88DHS0_FICCA|nr:hypothetical protein TIFTF001_010840 [Ficus carica]
MKRRQTSILTLLLSVVVLFSALNVALGGGAGKENSPFSPKAHLVRYWNNNVQNNLIKNPSSFLLSKASPLGAVESAVFAKLAAENSLSTRLPEFCSSAHLLCFPELGLSLEKHDMDSSFSSYNSKNFTNYGSERHGGADSFDSYNGDSFQVDSFRRSTKGSGDFKKYADSANVPLLRFTTYSDRSGGRKQTFKSYSDSGNFVNQVFSSYSKNSDGAADDFTSHANGANIMGTGFTGYGESRNRGKDSFTSYGKDNSLGRTILNSYGDGGDAEVEEFKSYRDDSNQGDDSFQSYAKNSKNEIVNFANYGNATMPVYFGQDNFTSYGQASSTGQSIGFEVYGDVNQFKEHTKDKKGVTFATYQVTSDTETTPATSSSRAAVSGSLVKSRVERGKFFRESLLKPGVVMPMPDIRDKMPKRSFLPPAISSKLLFLSSKIAELKKIFRAGDGSEMENMMADTLEECNRAPSKGETKRCVSSAEDMIDFATSGLGHNIVLRSTENVSGSKKEIMIPEVKGINGGKATLSVSCHQSLFPYLVYYCHSVPKVRV